MRTLREQTIDGRTTWTWIDLFGRLLSPDFDTKEEAEAWDAEQ